MKLSKRIFDLLWTVLGMLFLWPFFLVIALLIMLDDRGPVFYRQERVGLHGRPFRMWKFRTMVTDADKVGKRLTVGRDPRITRVGYWLRKLKLDEFPQLFNVLAGEMSLVGPRPEVAEYVERYTEAQRRVLSVPPGITDPASIQYSNESELLAESADPEATYINEIMPEKIRINMEYVNEASVVSDFKVVLRTLLKIIS